MSDETTGTSTPKKARSKPRAKAKSKKKAAKKSEGAGRTSRFSGKRIIKLVKENPRRKGSLGFKSFSKIKSGMKYEQYISAGGRRSDLAYDVDHKYVRVAA